MTIQHTPRSLGRKKTAAAFACAALAAAQALAPASAWADDDHDHDGDHGHFCHLIASEQGKEGTATIHYVITGAPNDSKPELGQPHQGGGIPRIDHNLKTTVFWHSHIEGESEANLRINNTLPVSVALDDQWANINIGVKGDKATVTAQKKAKDAATAGFAEINTLAEMTVQEKAPLFEKNVEKTLTLKNPKFGSNAEGIDIDSVTITLTPVEHCHGEDHDHDHGEGDDHDHGEGHDHDHGEGHEGHDHDHGDDHEGHDHDHGKGHDHDHAETHGKDQDKNKQGSAGQVAGPVIGVLAVLAILGGLTAAAAGMIPGLSLPVPAMKM